MGYLNKATITVDAILTNRGRELLAQSGRQSLNITKFAVADDEIDYGLYNTAHPEGTEYYGSIIENMPVLEATPDEQQIMRYKLVSLQSLGTTFVNSSTQEIYIPRILGFDNIPAFSSDAQRNFSISTTGGAGTYPEGYTLIVADATLFNIYAGSDISATPLNTPSAINANGSITLKFAKGTSTPQFTMKRVSSARTGSTTVTIFGDETGAVATATLTVTTS